MAKRTQTGSETAWKRLDDRFRVALERCLTGAGAVRVASEGRRQGPVRSGFHEHRSWELFFVLRGGLAFEVAGRPVEHHEPGSVVLVPPGTIHLAIDRLSQPAELEVLVVGLPNDEAVGRVDGAEGELRGAGLAASHEPAGVRRVALSGRELMRWGESMGASPHEIVRRVADSVEGSDWSKRRGAALLRLLVSSFAEIAGDRGRVTGIDRRERLVAEVMAVLETRYFDAELTVGEVAKAVGISDSHMGTVFREFTGQTIHRALLELRMRKARELLTHSSHSIKRIAAMTGWSNQLYFATAFRRDVGEPPSAFRRRLREQAPADT